MAVNYFLVYKNGTELIGLEEVVEIAVGESVTLTVTVRHDDGTSTSSGVSWITVGTNYYSVSNQTDSSITITGIAPTSTDNDAPLFASHSSDSNYMWHCFFRVVGSSSTIPVTSVSVSPSSLSLAVGQSSTLSATVYPTNATDRSVYWTTSDSSIATVGYSSGQVTAISAGTAIIRAYTNDGGYSDYCTVTVTSASVAVTGVSVTPSTLNLSVGQTSRLTATVSPSNATNKAVSWSSTNSSVASVDSSGLVTAKAAGNATIYAITSDGNYGDTCDVTVNAASSGEGCGLYLDCINYAESTYDYGLVSNIGQTLSTSATSDGTTGSTKVKRNFSGSQSSSIQTVDYGTLDEGTYVIYAKYLKDGSVDNGNDSLKFKVRLEPGEGYSADYTVEDVSGASYGFSLTSDGYYTSENAGISSSAALCKITVVITKETSGESDYSIYLDCINYAESGYDYGILSNIGQTLGLSTTDDGATGSTKVKKNFKDSNSSSVQTIGYGNYGKGTYVIYAKFRKDGSVNNNNDSLKFKVRLVNNGSGTSNATYTVEDVSGSTYGFSLTSDGYYTSENTGVSSSYAICKITIVIPDGTPAYPISATISQTSAIIMAKSTLTLTATIEMSDGSTLPESEMVWESSNTGVASVNNGYVSATNAAGVLTISVYAASDSSVKATCNLTVISITLNRTGDSLTGNVGEGWLITATVYPSSLSNRYVKFELVQNGSVMTAINNSMNEGGTYDTDGSVRLSAVGLGTCTLRIYPAYYPYIYRDFVITIGGELITEITFPAAARYFKCARTDLSEPIAATFTPFITPDTATNKVLNWSLETDSPESIRLINTTGESCSLYCWHICQATITATATDGSGVTASRTIYVVPAPFIYTGGEWTEAGSYICDADGDYVAARYAGLYPNLPLV